MGKRLGALGAALAVLGLTLSIVAPAMSDEKQKRVRFTLRDRSSDDERFITDVNVGPRGFGPGDYLVLGGDPVFNRDFSRRLGEFRGDCLLVRTGPRIASFECDVTTVLAHGRITVEGPLTFGAGDVTRTTFAITGGTGKYKTAHGEVRATFTPAGGTFVFNVLL